jgi:hypothetical protein
VRLRKILVLTNEEGDLILEVLIVMSLDSVPYALSLTYIDRWPIGFRIRAGEEVDARSVCLLSRYHRVELGPGSRDSLACPVRQFRSPESLRVAMNQEELDSCAWHYSS